MLATASRDEDGGVVVEAQAVAQGHGPGGAAVVDGVAGDHLRLGAELGVQAVERVEDQQRVVAGDVGAGDDGVEHGEVGDGDEAQGGGALGGGTACGRSEA